MSAFTHVQHPDLGVEHDVPTDSLPAWVARGWQPYTPPALDDLESVGEPPRAGKGSSTAAWAEHASTLGVPVPDDASRDDIVAAVDAARDAAAERAATGITVGDDGIVHLDPAETDVDISATNPTTSTED